MQKPNAVVLFNPPKGANVEFPPTEILENGFIDGDPDTPLYAKNENAFEKQNSSWLKYLTIDKVYHVETTGSDTTGDGTVDLPYATPKKAIEQLITGQSGEIILGAGNFDIDADISLYNNNVYIHEETGNSTITFKTYLNNVDRNDFYKIKLYDSSVLKIRATRIVLEDVNATKQTSANACGIASYSGMNKVDLYASYASPAGIMLPTNKGTSVFPSIIKNFASAMEKPFTAVSISAYTASGSIVTGENGYIFDTAGLPSALYGVNTNIDYPDFWVENGINTNQILTTGVASTSIGASITLYINGSALDEHDTSTFNDTDSDATIEGIVAPLIANMFVMENVDIVFSTVRTSAPEKVRSMTIEVAGDFAGKSLPFGIYFSGTDRKGYFYELQKAQRNLNVVTNIVEIK